MEKKTIIIKFNEDVERTESIKKAADEMMKADPIKRMFKNVIEINSIISTLDEEDRYTWMMTVASCFIHDLPEDLREAFLKNYETLRDDVINFCGR